MCDLIDKHNTTQQTDNKSEKKRRGGMHKEKELECLPPVH